MSVLNRESIKWILQASPSSSSFLTTGSGFLFLSVAFIFVKRSLSSSACVLPGGSCCCVCCSPSTGIPSLLISSFICKRNKFRYGSKDPVAYSLIVSPLDRLPTDYLQCCSVHRPISILFLTSRRPLVLAIDSCSAAAAPETHCSSAACH